ncbi:threonyl-tRNA synthetase [Acidiphilium sp. MT5]
MNELDHRQLGNNLDLFHQQEEGPGMVFWHPRGWELYRVIEDYIRSRMRRAGFQEIRTPQLLARSLWEQSGHWEKFRENMYSLIDGERAFCLKPMSCPCHVQVFKKHVRSYRDLPIRYSEFGACHRDEPSGSLQGLMRTRAFVQDDAHVFCTESHIELEVRRFCNLLTVIYGDLGFPDFTVAFSTRPAKRAGTDEVWDHAEAALSNAAERAGLKYIIQEGEGAFYGPKLEFHLTDARGRNWQCGTVQLDLVLPGRLGAEFVSESNTHEIPVMIHHAVLGSMERFIGMLLEHYEGWLPVWMAPDQVVVASVSSASDTYASHIQHQLLNAGVRATLDDRSERLPRKIIDAREHCVPIFLAVGKRDQENQTVSLRLRDGSQKTMNIAEAIEQIREEALSPICKAASKLSR